MDTKKALLIIIVVIVFALIVVNVNKLTGYTTSPGTILTVTPSTINPGDTVTITVIPEKTIRDEIKILKQPAGTREIVIDLDCISGPRCKKGENIPSVTHTMSFDPNTLGRYVVKVYDLEGNEVKSESYMVI